MSSRLIISCNTTRWNSIVAYSIPFVENSRLIEPDKSLLVYLVKSKCFCGFGFCGHDNNSRLSDMGTQPSPGIDTYLPDHLCEMPDTFYEQLWWSNPASFTTLLSPLVSDANISFISFTNNSHSFQYVLRPILRKHLTSSIQSPHLMLLPRNIPKKVAMISCWTIWEEKGWR